MMKTRAVRVLLVAAVGVAAWCVGVGAAVAAPGGFDATFGTDGMVLTDIGTANDSGRAVVVDSAGRIIVAGESYNGSDDDFAVVRYTSTGVLDTSFGTGGIVTTDINADSDRAHGVAIDSQDRIVAVGESDWFGTADEVFVVVRYTSAVGHVRTARPSLFGSRPGA